MANTYLDAGSGETLVFLHGFCESKQVWAEFIKPLQAQFRTIALDLPGFGDNTEHVSSYSMEGMADNVRRQLEELGVRKCILVGHSMGGYVSLAFAEKYSTMLNGLCLFHSSALPDTEEKKENRSKSIDFVERHGVVNFINPFVEPLFYQENRDRLRQEIELMKEIGRATPQESITGALAAMRDRPDRTAVLGAAKYPVLFIFGKEDGAVPMDKALAQCHLPDNSMVYFISKVGHMGMFERTYETRKTLQKFAETIYG
ncbi:pimeloyl-ACP methyl ester carboxylesterase [Pontibacter ummariensis]|uniref:Pimeloyl-ACP methyl ester carboxylesterase n=1 Tax=Pontibacter ummariensis TaxID=1610492 RepID=A0A239HCQ9_9BACT|nr:alpha/beta fold hydrolase [Pontibacter ummariensis]PRY10646.1 pimeloyl-ACP methyl ester carboxylesterase [Pontibacter ummariensis]SNS79167.1 Pimeloyl-ACP methyl ester carboxylesterase [Pontibacter ummariensis]